MNRRAAWFSLLFGLLLFIPVGVLGSSIGWPASLDLPAKDILPLIAQQEGAVRFGYLVYLVYSVLFLPTVYLIAQTLGDTWQTRLTVAFAAVSSLARSIGILRWLTVMPVLAANPDTNSPTMQLVYSAINTYGGGIGELLGVSLFASLTMLLLGSSIVQQKTLPIWLGWFAWAAALALILPWLEVFGFNLGPIISISTSIVQFWFLSAAIVLFLRRENA